MTAARPERRGWPLRRWLIVFSVIFLIQFGLITWLGQPALDIQTRAPRRVPTIGLIEDGREIEIQGVISPTLFVLASQNGFSANAWLQPEPPVNPTRPWTEPTRPLAPVIAQFGGTMSEFVREKVSQRIDVAKKPQPTIPDYIPIETLAQSTFSIEGDAARRRLLSDLKLESKPSAEILSNSVVQIAVDAGGNVFSAVLLADGRCGSPEADADAVKIARSARFQPIVRDGPDQPASFRPQLDWGRIVFRWNTVPLPATNAATAPR